MPQAYFLCIDSSDFMRNGDYSPNRIMAVQEGCSLLTEALMQKNPENVIGFLTFGGKACSVRETLTEDIDRVTGSLASIAVGGDSLFGYGVQIAMLALSHVKNDRSGKEIVTFVGSPIVDAPEKLQQLAKRLRKDDVGISIISLGCPGNTDILQSFVDSVGKNAFLYTVPEGGSVIDFLFTTNLMGGDGTSDSATGGVGAAATAVGGFRPGGVGDDADPELAMALRASLEEEQRRQAQQASESGTTTTTTTTDAAPSTTTTTTTTTTTNANTTGGTGANTEEDDLELALRLSMEEALRAEQEQNQQQDNQSDAPKTDADAAPPTDANKTSSTSNNANDLSEFEAAIADPSLQEALEKIAKDGDEKNEGGDDKKKDSDK